MIRLILILTLFNFLAGCQAAKDGLLKQKRSNADEFLVEKKNPLVLPPSYGDLPSPDETLKEVANDDTNEIKDLFSKENSSSEKLSKTDDQLSIENSILKKIKNK